MTEEPRRPTIGRKTVVIRNAFSNYLGFSVRLGIGFVLLPYMVHQMKDEAYGVWVLVASITGYYSVLDLGIFASVIRYVSKFGATGEKDKLNEIVNTSLSIFLIIGLGLLLITFALSTSVHHIFQVDPQLHRQMRWVFILMGTHLAIGLPLKVFTAVLLGRQQHVLTNLVAIIVVSVRAVAIYLVLRAGHGLVALGIIELTVNLIGHLVTIVLVRRNLPFLRLNLLRYSSTRGRNLIFSYGVFMFVAALADRAVYSSYAILIGALASAGAVTPYYVAAVLIDYMRTIIITTTAVARPAASELEAQGDFGRLAELLARGNKICAILALPIGAGFLLFGQPFINVWVGPEYVDVSTNILVILTVPATLGFMQMISYTILYGSGRHRFIAMVLAAEALLNIGICVVLIPIYGIVGAAIAFALPHAASILILPVHTCRSLGVPLWSFIRESYLRPFLAVLPMALLLAYFRFVQTPADWLTFFVEGAVSLGLYVFTVWYSCFSPEERHEWLHVLVPSALGFRRSRVDR